MVIPLDYRTSFVWQFFCQHLSICFGPPMFIFGESVNDDRNLFYFIMKGLLPVTLTPKTHSLAFAVSSVGYSRDGLDCNLMP